MLQPAARPCCCCCVRAPVCRRHAVYPSDSPLLLPPAAALRMAAARMEGRAGERRQRAQIAAGLAVLLVGLVAAVASVGDSGDGVELLQILHAGAGSSAKSASGAAPEGGSSAKSQLKVLRKTYGHEESLASKMDLKVDKEELAEKKPLLQAKKLMRAGMEDELAAKMDVDKASKMRAQAQKLKDKSEAARRKFVAQEKPVLLAQKLAEHDHKKYRSEELAVAKEVALLSEHPSSKKLRAKVDKLVKHSKEAKKRMAEDGMLLKKLEKKTADAQLGGERWTLYRACVFCLLVCARTRLKLLGTAATEQQLAARLVSVPADTESARQDGEMDSGRRHGRP